MTEERHETRAEEVARVRSYLASQSMRRTPAQLVETLRDAHQQFLAAVALVPDTLFRTAPREGEWSAIDVLLHMRTIAALDATAIPGVLKHGLQPPEIEDAIVPAPQEVTRTELLADLEQFRQQLITSVLEADPLAQLAITWGHGEFGQMNWREWLLFARVHTLDHTRQMQAIAAALVQQEGTEHETGH
ncbi:MAG TPA: DinB family protein [Ktedonosporobacter sp.]|nr:DinB family protein [Ktedonosporobacter sp.]